MSRGRDILKWHAELAREELEPHPAYSLYRDSAALLVVDMQGKLASAMQSEAFDFALKNTLRLIHAAHQFQLPILISEQYPAGLGPSLPEILEAAGIAAGATKEEQEPEGTAPVFAPSLRFDKTSFSCAEVNLARQFLEQHRRRQLIVVGQETHVCVFQSVRDLIELGYFVHVAKDACISRSQENRQVGFELMQGVGATLSSTETLIFDLLRDSRDPAFKAMSKLIR